MLAINAGPIKGNIREKMFFFLDPLRASSAFCTVLASDDFGRLSVVELPTV
jgi:hypothetical protein